MLIFWIIKTSFAFNSSLLRVCKSQGVCFREVFPARDSLKAWLSELRRYAGIFQSMICDAKDDADKS